MKQIADKDGKLIPHLSRDKYGSIIVNDPINKAKYEQQRLLVERVNTLEKNIDDIKSMLQVLISKQ